MTYIKDETVARLLDDITFHQECTEEINRDEDYHKDKIKEIKEEIIRRDKELNEALKK